MPVSLPGHPPCTLTYTFTPSLLTLGSTKVPPSLGGRGLAKLLAEAAFQHAVKDGRSLELRCWYLEGYLRKKPNDEVIKLLTEEEVSRLLRK